MKLTKILLILILCQFTTSFCAEEAAKPKTYNDLLNSIKSQRDSLYQSYLKAPEEKRSALIDSARGFLFKTITTDLFASWYGTSYDYYGKTRTPHDGSIACGYFVTTILSDAGFNIPRNDWGELASEIFIKKMSNDLKKFRNEPVQDVIDYIKSREDGVYMVGLDYHTGFIYKKANTIKFVHSYYYTPKNQGVMAENLDTNNPLNESRYRIIGRILDDEIVVKWLKHERIE